MHERGKVEEIKLNPDDDRAEIYTQTEHRRRITNCKYSSELINRSIYHKERVICYTIIARNEPYTYIHTYINTQYETKLF